MEVSTGTVMKKPHAYLLEGGLVCYSGIPACCEDTLLLRTLVLAAFLIRPFLFSDFSVITTYSTAVLSPNGVRVRSTQQRVKPKRGKRGGRAAKHNVSRELIMSENRECRTTNPARPRESTHTYFVSDYCTYSLGTGLVSLLTFKFRTQCRIRGQ
jgi:hypothetical protein